MSESAVNEGKKGQLYAYLEIMGHGEMLGRVEEVIFASQGFVRCTVIDEDGNDVFSRDFNPKSIFAFNWVDEETARYYSSKTTQKPVIPYKISQEHMEYLVKQEKALEVGKVDSGSTEFEDSSDIEL